MQQQHTRVGVSRWEEGSREPLVVVVVVVVLLVGWGKAWVLPWARQ